jgi:hypothetical protein
MILSVDSKKDGACFSRQRRRESLTNLFFSPVVRTGISKQIKRFKTDVLVHGTADR